MNGTGWPATCRPAPNTAAPHRPEPAWTRSCPGPRKDAPAVVPPGILARVPARNPGSPQSRPMPLRCMTPRVTPSCPQHRNTIPRVPRLLTIGLITSKRAIYEMPDEFDLGEWMELTGRGEDYLRRW